MNRQFMRPLATLKNRKTELQIFDMPSKFGRNNNTVDIYYFHESISREHCIFECINGRYTVTDLGSTVGTFIEGVRLEPNVPYNIDDKAKMKIGKVKFTFFADYGELASRSQQSPKTDYAPPHHEPASKKEGIIISAKELNDFEYNEEEVIYIDCGIQEQSRPMSYTNELKKKEIVKALDMKETQKLDLSELEEDTGKEVQEISAAAEPVVAEINNNNKTIHLTWIDDETGETKIVNINRFPFYMGRKSSENDYAIAKKGFSRKHMHFEERNGEFFICDDNSTNGTKLNGSKIESGRPVSIKAGDRLGIAGITFHVDIR